MLPVYSEYANINDQIIIDMLLEHVKLRAGMNKLINGQLLEGEMRQLGKELETHIRKEEKIIFPMIEKPLPENILKEIEPYFHE